MRNKEKRVFTIRDLQPQNFLDFAMLHFRYSNVVSDFMRGSLIQSLGEMRESGRGMVWEVVVEGESLPQGYFRADGVVVGVCACVHILFRPGAVVDSRAAAREALSKLFGDEKLNLHRVSAVLSVENGFAIRLAEDVGFRREGRLREADKMGGEWKDLVIYGLLRDEFMNAEGVHGREGEGRWDS